MRLLIDGTTAGHATGIGVVIDGLVRGLANHELHSEICVAVGPESRLNPVLQRVPVKVARTKVGRLLFQRVLFPSFAARFDDSEDGLMPALLPDAYAPILDRSDRRYTSFVHDTLPLTHPGYWSLPERAVKSLAHRSLLRARATLVTSSAHNARLIKAFTGRDATVARFGCGQLDDSTADHLLGRIPPRREPYILYIGAIDERKNVRGLLAAFDRVRPLLSDDFRLLILGSPRGPGGPALVDAISSADRVTWLPAATPTQALGYMGKAAVLAFPSHAEGFGLPVLEALAMGTPVVASDIPEITSWASGAALFADPHRVDAIADALHTAVMGAGPPSGAGQELAQQYRWGQFSADLVDVALAR